MLTDNFSDGDQCLASNTRCGHHWQVKSQPPLSADDEADIGSWYTNVLMSLLSVDDIVKDIHSTLSAVVPTQRFPLIYPVNIGCSPLIHSGNPAANGDPTGNVWA